jgi:hypothetical protein
MNIANMKIQIISQRDSEKLIGQSDDPRIGVDQIICMDHFLCGSVSSDRIINNNDVLLKIK